jgi:predicted NAD-dependent protein-ADP-ribosyltransferase YbiA (DUF1768 family)
MSPHPIWKDGQSWPTAEALFQGLRFPPLSLVRAAIREQKSPMAAKMISKKYKSERVIEPQSIEDVEKYAARSEPQNRATC